MKKVKIIKEATWGIFGQLLSACLTLAGIRVITEFASVEHYGQYVLFSTFALLIVNVLSGSIFQSFLRLIPEKGKSEALRLSSFIVNVFLKLIFISLLLFILLDRIILLQISLIFFFVLSEHFIGLFQSLINIEKKQKKYALFQITFSLLKPFFAILFYVFFHQEFISMILQQFFLSFKAKFRTKDFEDFFNFSKPLIMQKICGWSLRNVDKYFIAITLGTSSTGKYAPIVGLASMAFIMISRTVEIVLRPYYFEFVSKNKISHSRKVLSYYAISLFICSLLLISFFSTFSLEIVQIFFGSQFREYHYLLPFLSVSYSFLIFGYLFCNVCLAHKKSWNIFYVELFAAIPNLILMPICLINFGIVGSTYALMISYIVFFISGLIFARKLI